MDEEQVTFLRRVKQWGKTNFWFSIVMLVLMIIAGLSLAYGFMRADDTQGAADMVDALATSQSAYIEEAELLPDTAGNSQANGTALGASAGQLPCQASERARVLVPIVRAINEEKKLHQSRLKMLGSGQSVTQLLNSYAYNNEVKRHESVMAELSARETRLLTSIGCN